MADSAGDDIFYGRPASALMLGPGFYDNASGFKAVTASSTHGGGDAAYLYDSAGNDTLHLHPESATLQLAPASRTPPPVSATSTPTPRPGAPTPRPLADSSGTDTFYGRSHSRPCLFGSGFYDSLTGFTTVTASSTHGGERRGLPVRLARQRHLHLVTSLGDACRHRLRQHGATVSATSTPTPRPAATTPRPSATRPATTHFYSRPQSAEMIGPGVLRLRLGVRDGRRHVQQRRGRRGLPVRPGRQQTPSPRRRARPRSPAAA